MNLRRASRTTTAFNPVTAVGWSHAYWSEGTEMVAQGYTNGAAVGTWPDEIGTLDLTQGTAGAKPAFRTAPAVLNGKPAVDFDGGDLLTGSWSQSAPFSAVWVGYRDATATGEERLIDFNDGGTFSCIVRNSTTGKWGFYVSGFSDSTVTAAVGAWMIAGYFKSGASSAIVTNATTTSFTTAGTPAAIRFGLGAYAGGAQGTNMHTVFAGSYNGDVRSDGGWSTFLAGVTSYWGVTT